MEVVGIIIAIALMIGGFVGLFKDAKERGIVYVILEIVAVVLLICFA